MIVRYSRRAENDLAKILDYLDARSPRGARNVKVAIKRVIDLIGATPMIGHTAGRGEVRVMPVGRYPYLIYWTFEANEVWLVHIRHGARRPLAPTIFAWFESASSTSATKPGKQPWRGVISSHIMREWPLPKRKIRPPFEMRSAQRSAAFWIVSIWVLRSS